MPLFLFFVNKPLTIIPFLFGLIGIVSINIIYSEAFPITSFFFCYPFTAWYAALLIRHYILKDKISISGIQAIQLRALFTIFLWLQGLALLSACFAMAYIQNDFWSPFILFVFTTLCTLIFHKIIEAKLLSEVLKKNENLKEMDVNEFYKGIRKIILNKDIIK